MAILYFSYKCSGSILQPSFADVLFISFSVNALCLSFLSVPTVNMWVSEWQRREGSEQVTHLHTLGCQPTPLGHGKPPDRRRYTTGGWAGLD